MPFVPIDHTVAFAIDAAAKASDMQQVDQNIDDLDSRVGLSLHAGAVAIRVVEVAISMPTANTWTKFAEVEVWIPAGITTLNCEVRFKTDPIGGTVATVRMYIQASSTAGSEAASGATSYVTAAITIDPNASDKGAWRTIEFQVKSNVNSRAPTLHKDGETIGGVQRNYSGASYWS